MKKIIAFLLTIVMLFSLAACGGDTLIGASLSFSVKGMGKKELTVSVTDKFEEPYVLEYVFCDPEAQIYDVAITKDEEHEHEYLITPVAVGNHSFVIRFMSGEDLLGAVALNVIVGADGKMSYSDMSFNDISALYDALGEGAKITSQPGGAQVIQLANGKGMWVVDKFDEAIVTVKGPEYLDGNKISSFVVEAVGEGDTSVYMINKKENLQMILNFNSSRATDSVDSNEFILKFIDFVSGEIEKSSDSQAEQDYQKAKEVVASAADGEFRELNLPEGTIIHEASYFDDWEEYLKSMGGKPGQQGEKPGKQPGKQPTGSGISGEIEITIDEKESGGNYKPEILSDVTMEYNGYYMDYQTSAIISKEDYCLVVDNKEVIPKENKDLKIDDIDVKFYLLDTGVGVCIWEQSGISCRLTFMDAAHSSQEYQDLFTTLLQVGAV